MTHCPYMVIYPRGNRRKLDVAYVRDYEKADWDLASRLCFADEDEAKAYALELSAKHGIPVAWKHSGILD